MKSTILAGKFIVLDGPDGAGKSTQVALLRDWVSGHGVSAKTLRDPGGTCIGDKIRQILLDPAHGEMAVRTEAMLYMASRAQLYDQEIAPALRSDACVICDRWLSSTVAYQAVAGKIGIDVVLGIAEAGLERVWPDLTIIIDLPSDLGLQRVGPEPDRMEQKSARFHQRVREAFLELPQQAPQAPLAVVDGAGDPQQVHQRVLNAIQTHLA